jgi:hypothetical protein
MAARIASKSEASTNLALMPIRGKVTLNRL